MSQKEHGKKQVKKAVCGICASGCPMDVYVEDGKIISVEGSKNLPGQSGGLCAKGAAARQYIYNQERLLYPMKQVGEKGHGKFARISWEEAYQTIAEKLLSVRERYGARRRFFMQDIRNGIVRHCSVLQMRMDHRIIVPSQALAFRHLIWRGSPSMEMIFAFRIWQMPIQLCCGPPTYITLIHR